MLNIKSQYEALLSSVFVAFFQLENPNEAKINPPPPQKKSHHIYTMYIKQVLAIILLTKFIMTLNIRLVVLAITSMLFDVVKHKCCGIVDTIVMCIPSIAIMFPYFDFMHICVCVL